MSWSISEISALAAKAARGAGAPPAQAARFGQAAALHLSSGRDPAVLERALETLPAGDILAIPLHLDAALCASPRKYRLPDGLSDKLLTGYLEALPYPAEKRRGADGVRWLQISTAVMKERGRYGRIEGCEVLLAEMTRLAERTFVPETEASRRSGAGAGLTDND
jgi:hypothetical protein